MEGGEADVAGTHTAVVFAVVTDHENNFPFEDITIMHQAARNAGYVLAGTYLLELAL